MRREPPPFKTQIQRIAILIVIGIVAGSGIFIYRFGLLDRESEQIANAPVNVPVSSPAPNILLTPTENIPLRPDGLPYPKLYIPEAGISEYIIESALTADGWQVNHLGNRIGHLQGTTDIGQPGNIVLAGHIENAEGEASVFATIDEMEIGSPVTLLHLGQEFHYRVMEVKTVDQSDLSVVYPVEGSDRLTLITCTGYDFISGVYNERVVVVAERVQG